MGRLTALAAAVAVTLVVTPAPAAARVGKGPASAPAAARTPALVPLHRAACLSPIPGQECAADVGDGGDHGDCTLCTAPTDPRPPEPVVVDCRDPSVAWLQEMVGQCDMPPAAGDVPALTLARDHPREPTCLDGEACSAPRPPAAAGSSSFDAQPVALPRRAGFARFADAELLGAAVLLRRDLGFRPPLLRPPNG